MDECRWLDDEEQRTWRAFLVSTRLLFAQLERELQQNAGIPLAYYEVLVQLSEAPEGSMRMSELADIAQASRSRLSHAVNRLEEIGWVRRENCPNDRRGAFAVLTEDGRSALVAAAPGHVEGVRQHLFDQLTADEIGQLRRIGERLLDHLATLGISGRCTSGNNSLTQIG